MSVFVAMLTSFSIVLAFVVIALVVATMSRQSKINPVIEYSEKSSTIEDKIAPFIEIHKTRIPLEHNEKTKAQEREMAERIQSFRHRNRFYEE